MHIVQPLTNPLRRCWEAYQLERWRGRPKIEPINVSPMWNGRKAYLRCIIAIWSLWRPIKGIRRTKELTFKSRMLGKHWHKDRRLEIEHISINQVGEGETTYRGHACIMQPPGNNSKWLHRVYRPRHQCGHIKTAPTNINQTERNRNTYLECINTLWPIWRPGKQIRRVSKLTIESRMPGEPWRDIDDYGWRPMWVAINGRIWAQCDLPNPVMMWKSCKCHKPLQQQVSYSIQIGHIPL